MIWRLIYHLALKSQSRWEVQDVEELAEEGTNRVSWNGTDRFGNTVASGMYIIRVQYQHQNMFQKIVYLK